MSNPLYLNNFYLARRKNNKRIIEIDFLRGFCIVLMIIDHFFYDFAFLIEELYDLSNITNSFIINLQNFATFYWDWDVRINVRYFIIALFFFLSGLSSYFSRDNLKRGLLISIVGLLINIITFSISFIVPGFNSSRILFGTINAFGLSILIYGIIEVILNKFNKNNMFSNIFLIIVGLIIVFVGYFGTNFFNKTSIYLYEVDFKNYLNLVIGNMILTPSADSMPIVPYLGYLLIGVGLASFLYKNKVSIFTKLSKFKLKEMNRNNFSNIYHLYLYKFYSYGYKTISVVSKTINFIGRYSFYFYIFHQIGILFIVIIIMYINGFSINI